MLCCLNPDCPNPHNPDGIRYCQSCSATLKPLLRGHYRITGVLSDEGGFGRTYLAEDLDKLNELGVVKQLAPKVHGTWALNKAIELFKQEAKRLQELGRNQRIPTLLAYFEEDNYLYLVQEFVDGLNLFKELQQRSKYNETEIRELLLDLLPVLKFIHEHGVVHRDLKPQNIIRRQFDNKLVLIDFGASKQLTATVQTKPGTTIGSFGYSPIEQIQGGEVCPASDFFSLGATCFHLLSGIPPFYLWTQQGYGWVSTWRQHIDSPLSNEFALVLERLLKKDIQERYQSADEVIRDLTLTPGAPPPTQIPSQSPSREVNTTNTPDPKASSSSLRVKLFSILRRQTSKQSRSQRISTIASSLNLSKHDLELILKWLTAIAIIIFGLVGSQIYGYVRYGFLVSNPIFLIASFPSSNYLQKTLSGHSNSVASLAYNPNGQILASGSYDNTIKLWNLTKNKEISTFKGHSAWVAAVAITPNNKNLVSGSYDNTIKLWNLVNGRQIRTFKGHSDSVGTLLVTKDGKNIISGSFDRTIKVWNLGNGEEIRTLSGHSSKVSSIAVSPDNKTLVSGSDDQTIKIWNLVTGELIRTLEGHKDKVSSVAISPDGKTLVSGSHDRTVKLWNLTTGEEIRTFTSGSKSFSKAHSEWVSCLAISPDGNILASGSGDRTIKLWSLVTGEEIDTLKGHSGYITSLSFSPAIDREDIPYQQTLSSGAMGDNTIKVWRMSQ